MFRRKLLGILFPQRWFVMVCLLPCRWLLYHECLPLKDDALFQCLILRSARVSTETYLILDFGQEQDYRLPNTTATQALLSPDAVGTPYWVKAAKPIFGDGMDVHALKDDQQDYLTFDESALLHQQSLPKRLSWIIFMIILLIAAHLFARSKYNTPTSTRRNPS